MINFLDLTKIRISSLTERDSLRSFNCGVTQIDRHAKKKAAKQCEKKRARVFIAHDDSSKIAKGFFQLSLSLEDDSKLKKGDERDLWAGSAHLIYVNWLAVQTQLQGNKLGTFLLMDALVKAYRASIYLPILGVGIRPLNERNKITYSKHGFQIGIGEEKKEHPLMIMPIWHLHDLFEGGK